MMIVPQGVSRLLRLMNRELGDVDSSVDRGHSWTLIKNDNLPQSIYALGAVWLKYMPQAWEARVKAAISTMTNFRAHSIVLPDDINAFNRLYLDNTVYHTCEVEFSS